MGRLGHLGFRCPALKQNQGRQDNDFNAGQARAVCNLRCRLAGSAASAGAWRFLRLTLLVLAAVLRVKHRYPPRQSRVFSLDRQPLRMPQAGPDTLPAGGKKGFVSAHILTLCHPEGVTCAPEGPMHLSCRIVRACGPSNNAVITSTS